MIVWLEFQIANDYEFSIYDGSDSLLTSETAFSLLSIFDSMNSILIECRVDELNHTKNEPNSIIDPKPHLSYHKSESTSAAIAGKTQFRNP
jgi:hypothetical protein